MTKNVLSLFSIESTRLAPEERKLRTGVRAGLLPVQRFSYCGYGTPDDESR